MTDPAKLVQALTDADWLQVGGRVGQYARMARNVGDRHHLMIPLDPTAPEHDQMLTAVLTELAGMVNVGKRAADVLNAIKEKP